MLYEKYFVDTRLGLTGIREYPKGQEGDGDIDSGPVIWGIGGAASLVGQRAAGIHKKEQRFVELRNIVEAFGTAYQWNGKKRFIFGQLAVADAFIAWANAVEQRKGQFKSSSWRGTFKLFSLGLFLLIGWVICRI